MGRGGDAYGLTHQNTVPLLKVKFDSPIEKNCDVPRLPPPCSIKKTRKMVSFPTFSIFWKNFYFLQNCLLQEKNFLSTPSLYIP